MFVEKCKMTSHDKYLGDNTRTVNDKKRCNFHNISIILCVVYLILLTIGLWACAIEINKLKQTTNAILDSISQLKSVHGQHEEDRTDSNLVFKDGIKQHQNVRNNEHSNVKVTKKQYKRESIPTYERKDPLSSNTKVCMFHFDLFDKFGIDTTALKNRHIRHIDMLCGMKYTN